MREFLLAASSGSSGVFRVDQVGADGRVAMTAAGGVQRTSLCRLDHLVAHVDTVAPVRRGDIVRLSQGRRRGIVCYRETDRHHALFVTNQCNSRCLMCSQPPTPQEDAWLFDEAGDMIDLIEAPPPVIGITGGEPTLHPARLNLLLKRIHASWPETLVEVLSNARALAHDDVTNRVFHELPMGRKHWLVPLYGASDEMHDFVVQSSGAFDETIAGLLNLHVARQVIQLRTVLIRPVLERLPELCAFIAKNLPFVNAVALMGAEPIGFALANPELCIADPMEFEAELIAAVGQLVAHGLRPVLMNIPLCKLPQALRRYAAVSISDWKNEYAPECEACTLRSNCSGFFVWPGSSIMRMGLQPMQRGEHV